MEFKGRSLYNLLRSSVQEDPSVVAEPWQIVDYSTFSEEDLFKGLSKLGIEISKENFILYAENADTPEDLVECLWLQEADFVGQEKAYLFVFELWRRLLPGKQTLSLFFHEFDEVVFLFDQGMDVEEEKILQVLWGLRDILDHGVDAGAKPEEIFASLVPYAAHNIESFLYDYIAEILEEGSDDLGSKLIDAFSLYMPDKKWFTLLKARLLALSDVKEGDTLLHRLLEEEEDPYFLQELGEFLAERGDLCLFMDYIRKRLSLSQDQGDLQPLIASFYIHLHGEEIGEEELEKNVFSLLESCHQKA